MNMSEKVGRLGRGLQRVNWNQTTEKICTKVMFYLIIFFMTERRTWRRRSRDQGVLNALVRFLSTSFVINWQVFAVFLTILYTVLSLSNYYSIFKAESNVKLARILNLSKLTDIES